MAGKVTATQIENAKFSTDDFRKAVNYENTKNKGYVRFVPDGQGGVKLEKVNNKIDFKISWRTNIDEEKNKSIREKFVLAMTNDLRWADRNDVERLATRITRKLTGENGGALNTDALSRKELEDAFKTYDGMMNTLTGRAKMIENLLKAAAQRCNLDPTTEGVEKLKAKYLVLAGDLADMDKMIEVNEGAVMNKPGYMKVDELKFKSFLCQLENACDEAVKRATVDTTLRTKAEGFIGPKAPANDFGLTLSNEETAEIRGALFHFLAEKGLVPQNTDGKVVGSGGMVFEKFITEVLPELFKHGIENVRAYGEGADDEMQLDANFSFDAIFEEAVKFMSGAREYINEGPKEEEEIHAVGKFAQIIEDTQKLGKNAINAAKVSAMQKVAINVMDSTNMNKKDGGALFMNIKGAASAYEAQGRLEVFTKKFLSLRGIGDGIKEKDEKTAVGKAEIDAIFDDVEKLRIAAKLQFGEAKKDPVTGIKKSVDNGMGAYLTDMEDAILQISTGKKGGTDSALMKKLFTFTLSNIVNDRINDVAKGFGTSLNLDEAGKEKAKEALRNTSEAYLSFESKVLKLMQKELNAFVKLATVQKKKGLINEATYNDLISRAQAKLQLAHKDALKEFFLKSPCKDVETGEKMLDRLFRTSLAEARGEFSNALAVNALSGTLGAKQKAELTNVAQRVAEGAAQAGLANVKVGVPGVISEEEAISILKRGALMRAYNEALVGKLKSMPKNKHGSRTVTDGFVESVKSAANSKIESIVKKAAKIEKDFIDTCCYNIKDTIKEAIKAPSNKVLSGYDKLTKDEQEKFMEELVDEVMRNQASRVKESLIDILEAPDAFENKDMKQLVTEFLTKEGIESTSVSIIKIATERIEDTNKFLDNKDTMKNLLAKVTERGVFAEKGTLAGLEKYEKNGLARQALNKAIERVRTFAGAYATTDKVALANRIADEAEKIAAKTAAAYAKFRADFLNGCPAVEADYKMLDEKTVNDVREYVLYEMSNEHKGGVPDAKMTLGYLRTQLDYEVNRTINRKKYDFAEYSSLVTKVYQAAMDKIRFSCNLANDAAGFAGLTAEAKEYLSDKLMPKLIAKYEAQIYRNPADFDGEAKIKALGDRIEKEVYKVIISVFEKIGPKKNNMEALILIAGANVILEDKNETRIASEDLGKWLSSEHGHQMLVANEKAMLDHIVEHGAFYDEKNADKFAPTSKDNPVAAFRAEVKEFLRANTVQLLYVSFDPAKIEESKKAFDKWLASHALSRFEDYSKTSAQERIEAMYAKRIADLGKKALNGGENEPILSPAFIQQVDQAIDSDGATMLVAEWKNAKLAEHMAALAQRDEAYMFDINSPRFASLPQHLKTVVTQNYERLTAVISTGLSYVGIAGDGLDGIDKVREGLEKIKEEDIAEYVHNEAMLRVEEGVRIFCLEEAAPDIIATYSRAVERELIKRVLGDEKAANNLVNGLIGLLDHPAVDSKSLDNIRMAIGAVRGATTSSFASIFAQCREKATIVDVFKNSIRAYSSTLVDIIMREKSVWKDILLPALTSVAKSIR